MRARPGCDRSAPPRAGAAAARTRRSAPPTSRRSLALRPRCYNCRLHYLNRECILVHEIPRCQHYCERLKCFKLSNQCYRSLPECLWYWKSTPKVSTAILQGKGELNICDLTWTCWIWHDVNNGGCVIYNYAGSHVGKRAKVSGAAVRGNEIRAAASTRDAARRGDTSVIPCVPVLPARTPHPHPAPCPRGAPCTRRRRCAARPPQPHPILFSRPPLRYELCALEIAEINKLTIYI